MTRNRRAGVMNQKSKFFGALLLATIGFAATPQAQTASSDEITNRVIEGRAIEAVIWGIPAVNYDLMLQAMIGSAKGKPNQIVFWSRLLDWKNQTLTPNPDVIYLMPFFDTKDAGPMVLEIPPADDGVLNGTIIDAWQVPLEDVGPAGVDKGKGGKYLILPPNHSAPVPDGYIPLPSMTYQGYALLRSILRAGAMPTSPRPSRMANVSSSTPYHRPRARLRRRSSTRSMSSL